MKKILLGGIFAVLLTMLIGSIGAVCCEKTISGGICIDVADAKYCKNDFRIDSTACESTQHCSTGTCVNNRDGTCVVSSSAACDPSLGGYFVSEKPEDIDDCSYGCCLIGDGAAFVGRVTCSAMASFYGVESDFRESIADEGECLLSAGPTAKGACVSQTDKGRSCTIETREKCSSENKEFHAGLLCSAPQLGTVCKMTRETTCVDGRNEVYFVDGCGNPANVYDASKVDDVTYWTNMIDSSSSEICNAGESNALSPECGNCNYLLGSTCGEERGAEFGDNICRDLSCTYKEEIKQHGESWCSQPIGDFESAKPGMLSYMLYCYDGEIQWELCGNERNGLCKGDSTTGEANCIPNRWQDCVFQNSSRDCLNTDKRDCEVENTVMKDADGEDILFLDTDTGEMKKQTCVPKYPPGFNFWKSETTIMGVSPSLSPSQVCGFASTLSLGGYRSALGVDWESVEGNCFSDCIESCEDAWKVFTSTCQNNCFKDCASSESFADADYGGGGKALGVVDLKEDWVNQEKAFCKSFGDCGVKPNYIGGDSYNAWKDLFVGGNISIEDIPGANDHQ